MPAFKKVLPGILQKHCCMFSNRNTESLCTLCGEPEDHQYSWSTSPYFDEESYSPPRKNMKGLYGGRPAHLQLTSPTSAHTCGFVDVDHSLEHHLHHGDSRPPSYLLSPTESCPLEGRHRFSPRSSIHSECMVMPASMAPTDHSVACSTFPRMHYGSASRDSGGNTSGGRDDGCSSSHGGSGKMNRIPANLLDQFEKQLPLHRDGFHTLQYQRTSTTTTTEQRNESPGRIRHLVHSVQKLFTKSHSLEGSSKMNGTKSDSHRDGSHHHHHHQGHHKHNKRSKSKDRKGDGSGRQRSGGWWSSDDNLDSDSTYRPPSVMSRHPVEQISHCYPDSVHSHLAGDLSLKTSKSNNDVKCSACESINMAPEGKFMKRSSWSTLTVSQAKEAYRKSSLNLEKPMTPTDLKPNLRPCHYLQTRQKKAFPSVAVIGQNKCAQNAASSNQLKVLYRMSLLSQTDLLSEVPQDEWGGYPGDGKDDEIPCRRMRSSSYVKAMGDEESGESDSSPKTSPQKLVRPDALVKAVIRPRELLDSQSSYRLDKINSDMRNYITNFAADLSQSYHLQTAMHPSIALDPSAHYNSPKFRSRNQSYMRAVSTLSQASCVSQVSQVSETEINGQFESVCESVFSEVESQAMDALDLPGCFRTRSHSYLRAIQAGYSQDDEYIPPMAPTVTSTIRSTTDRNYVQEDSCLPKQARAHEDVAADKAPLAHDDLGCPIRGDRSYRRDNMVATAKPLSGPPVTPILFRSPRPTGPERPSPKAIQASIKESATLAAAISMQWKEEVSAMRLELAELRRDLCKELRAFNSNFNTFTKHYNTWSPQSCKMPAGVGLGGGAGAGAGAETMTGAHAGLGAEAFGTSGAKEKVKHVSKVSVGTQARSKALVRQSTADAAVNCPEEKEKKKGTRKKLPKQLSMDPSILARPQSMYVESAIPLSLDPILPFSAKTAKTKPLELQNVGSAVKPETELELPGQDAGMSCDPVTKEPLTSDGTVQLGEIFPERLQSSVTVEQDMVITAQKSCDNPSNDYGLDAKPPHQDESKSTELDHIEKETVHLPFPVPVVTVSPPEEHEYDIISDSESPDDFAGDKSETKPVPLTNAGLEESKGTEPKDINLPVASTSDVIDKSHFFVCDAPTNDQETAPSCNVEQCPSIVVTEYFDIDSPESPTNSDPNPDPIVSLPDRHAGPVSEQMQLDSNISSISAQSQPNTEPESENSEWPPLPEPLDSTPIYHADLVHFDLVMLTSLDQEDLDSVFMDPEPEPLDLTSATAVFTHTCVNMATVEKGQSAALVTTDRIIISYLKTTNAITYTPSYKKPPPPVPPRTTSKPLISITAQSSTESTQDAYHEGRHLHGGMWGPDGLTLGLNPGRVLYNSVDSLDSAKAVTIAMEAAGVMAGKRHPSTDSHSSVLTCDKAILVSKAEEYLKTPRSSIGIQVEAATDSESESKGCREYHSVGIQVEDDKKGQGRFKRSNSVTTAVQADMELEGFPTMEDKGLQFGGGFQRHSEPSTPTQYGAVRTVRTQGLFSYREDYRTPAEPPSPRETTSEPVWQLEPPSPQENAVTSGESGRSSPSLRRDGSWFMQLLHTETKRIEGWCKEMEAEAEENDLSEELLGKIRSAVGSAQLLMSQKFQQFYWLCQQNLAPAPVPKKTIRQKSLVTREKSLDLPDRHRQEARRRLMAAKRAASFRQNSASERADSIEIYIPEAQTRL
ncbi:disks large-associated protein 2 [Vanacampus margaritifer]